MFYFSPLFQREIESTPLRVLYNVLSLNIEMYLFVIFFFFNHFINYALICIPHARDNIIHDDEIFTYKQCD